MYVFWISRIQSSTNQITSIVCLHLPTLNLPKQLRLSSSSSPQVWSHGTSSGSYLWLQIWMFIPFYSQYYINLTWINLSCYNNKACLKNASQIHARLMIAGAWLSSQMLQLIDNAMCFYPPPFCHTFIQQFTLIPYENVYFIS